jgi:hypothetical protein
MEILECERYFTHIEERCLEIKCAVTSHISKEFSSGHIVQEHIEKLVGMMRPMKSNNERMIEASENFFLTLYMIRLEMDERTYVAQLNRFHSSHLSRLNNMANRENLQGIMARTAAVMRD